MHDLSEIKIRYKQPENQAQQYAKPVADNAVPTYPTICISCGESLSSQSDPHCHQ